MDATYVIDMTFAFHMQGNNLNETIGQVDSKWKLQPHLQNCIVNNCSSHGICKEMQQPLSSDLWRNGIKFLHCPDQDLFFYTRIGICVWGYSWSLDTGSRQSPSQPAIPLKSPHFSVWWSWVVCSLFVQLQTQESVERHWLAACSPSDTRSDLGQVWDEDGPSKTQLIKL